MPTDPQLQALLDKDEIRQQLTNYARSVDRLDHALGKGVFHPEATADYGVMFQGTGWGFIDWCLESHLSLICHSHQFSNITIVLDGDTARSETYGDVTVRFQDETGAPKDMRNLGRYIDRWEKRDGAWRIIARRYVHEMDTIVPVPASMYPMTGRRDREDASYLLAEPARSAQTV
jgi:hypothetical protein